MFYNCSSTQYTGVNEILKPSSLPKLEATLSKIKNKHTEHDERQILPYRINRIAQENISERGSNGILSYTKKTHHLKVLNDTSEVLT